MVLPPSVKVAPLTVKDPEKTPLPSTAPVPIFTLPTVRKMEQVAQLRFRPTPVTVMTSPRDPDVAPRLTDLVIE
jgi:hypothetical protein